MTSQTSALRFSRNARPFAKAPAVLGAARFSAEFSGSLSLSSCTSACRPVPPRSYLGSTMVGLVLDGRFELQRLAGSGGMGEVFQSLDRTTGKLVAVKVLSDLRPTSAARFEREATVLSSVGHPAIVGYVAHGAMPTGERYLVMEWLEGEDLAACLTHRRLTLAETLVLGARIGEALGALHALGIVHRDVKPGNIFLVGGDVAQVKLLDLGLARSGEMTNLTQAGGLVGTLGYLAPEQARSEPSIDGRADVFSLGCVLFKCLTGTPAFAGEGMMALLANILFQEAPRLHDRCPEAPIELDALIARMLAKQPGLRPADGYAVAAALRALAGEPAPIPEVAEGDATIGLDPVSGDMDTVHSTCAVLDAVSSIRCNGATPPQHRHTSRRGAGLASAEKSRADAVRGPVVRRGTGRAETTERRVLRGRSQRREELDEVRGAESPAHEPAEKIIMRNWIIPLIATMPFAVACSASFPVPTQRMADAEAAERSAREVGADTQPTARLEVKLADEQIARAKALIASGDTRRADFVLMRARADAELALALAREQNANSEAQKAIEQSRVTAVANTPGARP